MTENTQLQPLSPPSFESSFTVDQMQTLKPWAPRIYVAMTLKDMEHCDPVRAAWRSLQACYSVSC